MLPPLIIPHASRDDAPLATPGYWFVWSEVGAFRLERVQAKSWYAAREIGAALMGLLSEQCDAAREVTLRPNFGRYA